MKNRVNSWREGIDCWAWITLWFSMKCIAAGLEISYSDHPKITTLKYIPLIIVVNILFFRTLRKAEKDEK